MSLLLSDVWIGETALGLGPQDVVSRTAAGVGVFRAPLEPIFGGATGILGSGGTVRQELHNNAVPVVRYLARQCILPVGWTAARSAPAGWELGPNRTGELVALGPARDPLSPPPGLAVTSGTFAGSPRFAWTYRRDGTVWDAEYLDIPGVVPLRVKVQTRRTDSLAVAVAELIPQLAGVPWERLSPPV